MSNRQLTTWIDGQEVLPVRAIPYVTESARFGPDVIARRFAEDDPRNKNWTLKAYESLGGGWFVITPLMWEEIVFHMESFETQLKGQFPTHIAGYAVWRNGAVAVLPAGTFVRLDEFQKTFQHDLDGVIFCGDRPTKDKLTLSPNLDASIREMVMEGFERFADHNPAGIPPCLHEGQSAPQMEPETNFIKKTTKEKKRMNENDAFLLDCERKGIPKNIESIWLYIRQNAGKDNFLFMSASQNNATTLDGRSVAKKSLGRVLRDKLKQAKTSK